MSRSKGIQFYIHPQLDFINSTAILEKFQQNLMPYILAIPLKGGRGKQVELNENFVKVIEHEYAVRY